MHIPWGLCDWWVPGWFECQSVEDLRDWAREIEDEGIDREAWSDRGKVGCVADIEAEIARRENE